MTVLHSTVPQRTSTLPYEILLQKCGGQLKPAEFDTTSTVAPDTASVADTISRTCSSDTCATSPDDAKWVPSKGGVKFLKNVSTSAAKEDETMAQLLASTRALSEQIFDEDCLLEVTKRSGWRLSLLTTHDQSMLCGFIVMRTTQSKTLVIKKLAVPSELRGCGFGKLIIEEVIKSAKQQGDVCDIRLSSLADAVTFYQRMGFKALTGMKLELDPEVEYTEGQVYMEKKLRGRNKKK